MTYDYWRPSQEQRDKVNEVASDRRPELLEESYREALAWLEDVDEFSPTPDPAMATILKRALSRVQFYNQTVPDVDLPSPQWTPRRRSRPQRWGSEGVGRQPAHCAQYSYSQQSGCSSGPGASARPRTRCAVVPA
uniref:YkwA n=1 Tax=Corynebacterium jeikeium TaxID=38289 RepID=Q83ZU3_CORJE|nr:YkwA [Corynebacterium jeikeium]